MTSAARAIRHVAALSAGPPVDPSMRITLNFHPDRRGILRSLAEGGVYRSQFVTGTSNGKLGGERVQWESRIFGGAYDDAPAYERPVYGALDFRRQALGGAPRFGSAHVRLTAETLGRATFCYPDSHLQPADFGVAEAMSLIELVDAIDPLDDYVEAQVHGPVLLGRDVEALVLDPSYRGTDVAVAAGELPCPVEYHHGLQLSVAELRRHPDYRGPEFVELGAAIAEDGRLDPRIIGDAARTGRYDEQALKRVWHLLARFGTPPAGPPPGTGPVPPGRAPSP